LIGYASSRD